MAIYYVGGKTKIAKDILSVILPGNEDRPYFEPFVGSAAFLCAVPMTMGRHANDKNPYMIALHEAVRDGWEPPLNVSEEEYQEMKRFPGKYPPHLIGFVSIGCSFGAKMWGGYARGKNAKGEQRNYAAEAAREVLSTKPFLSGVKFTTGSFHEMNIPDGALVYCDPPYAGTLGYGDTNTTNVGVNFWGWCNDLVARDCRVFVSGYKQNKTTDWDIIWSKDVNLSLDNNRGDANWRTARTEALFCHRSQSGIERKPEAAPEVIVDCCPQCKSTEKETTLAACETSDGYNKWHGDL